MSVSTSTWSPTNYEPDSCSSFDFADTSKDFLRWGILVIQLVLRGGTGLFEITGFLSVLMGSWIKRQIALWESGHDIGVVGVVADSEVVVNGVFIRSRLDDFCEAVMEQILFPCSARHRMQSGSDKFRKGKRPFCPTLPYQIAQPLIVPDRIPLFFFVFPTVARSRLLLLPYSSPSFINNKFQPQLHHRETEDVRRT